MDRCIVSHKDCPDGCASVILAKVIYPDIQYVLSNHRVIDEICYKRATLLEENGVLFLLDICCSSKQLDKIVDILIKKKASIKIFDHHSSQSWLLDYQFPKDFSGEIIFTNDKCASKIFYDEYVDKEKKLLNYKEFIEIINDRDMWINKRLEGHDFALLHDILGDSDFIDRFLDNSDVLFYEKEKTLLEYQKKRNNNRILKNLKRVIIKTDKQGFRYGVIHGEASASDLLNMAIEKHKLEYAILINLHSKSGSIRGLGNFDCAEFAKKFGGGGHRKASGFRVDFDFDFTKNMNV